MINACFIEGVLAAQNGDTNNPYRAMCGSSEKISWETGWLVQRLFETHEEQSLYRYSSPAGAD